MCAVSVQESKGSTRACQHQLDCGDYAREASGCVLAQGEEQNLGPIPSGGADASSQLHPLASALYHCQSLLQSKHIVTTINRKTEFRATNLIGSSFCPFILESAW